MNRRTIAAICLASLFAIGFFNTVPVSSGATSSSTSCPTNQTIRIAAALSGVPNGFNHLTANKAGGFTQYIMYATLQPFRNPYGVVDQSSSILGSMVPSNNYTTWTLNVKPGLMWSDGTPVTSADILATMGPNFAFNPSYDFVNAHLFVKQEYAPNSTSAVFVLNQSNAYFPETISDPVFTSIAPKQATSVGPNFTGIGVNVVGDGPFEVSNYQSGDTQALLTRNPYYNPLPGACAVIISYLESTSNIPTQLIANQADLGLVDPGDVASTLAANPNLQLAQITGHEEVHMLLNSSYYPYNFTQFRQAIVYAINESAILQQVWNNQGTTAYNAQGSFPPGTAYYTPNQKQYSFSPSTALQLLSTMGINKGSDGHLQFPNGTDITLDLFADTGASTDPVMAQMVQNDLQNLGFKVNEQNAGLGALISASNKPQTSEVAHGLVLESAVGSNVGSPFTDAQSVCLSNYDAFACQNGPFLNPPSAYANWVGNSTAVLNTNNPAIIKPALANIQNIWSTSLPVITLAYPVEDWIYNTQNFNFVSPQYVANNLLDTGVALNKTFLASLCPIGMTCGTSTSSSTSSTTTSPSTSTISSTSTNSVSSSTTTSSTTTTSSSSKSSTGIAYPGLGLVAVVATLGLLYVGFASLRRREKW